MFSLIGIILVFVCTVVSILWAGASIGDYIDPPSIFIVFGGVIASTMASFEMSKIKELGGALKNVFKKIDTDMSEDVDLIVNLANVARRDGLLTLEDMTSDMKDPFLKKGIMLVVDGSDPELIQSIMETDLAFTRQRHSECRTILEAASAYAPAYGMIGTLIGLVNMLNQLSDFDSLGTNMAVAIITTFYGSLIANGICLPLAKKLKAVGNVEYLRKEMMLEGILAIQNGENPRMIKEKLYSFLSNTDALKADAKEKSGGKGDNADG